MTSQADDAPANKPDPLDYRSRDVTSRERRPPVGPLLPRPDPAGERILETRYVVAAVLLIVGLVLACAALVGLVSIFGWEAQ